MLYWLLKYVILGPLLKLIFRPQVEGLRNVPATGPVILASNHLSFSDSIFMPLITARKVTFVAKAEYFTGKGIKGWLTKMFFVGTGTIPVDRSGGRAAPAPPWTPSCRCCGPGECPASTPRAPGPRTGGSTGARPAWPGSPWRAARWWCRWRCSTPTRSSRPGKLIPKIDRVKIRFGPPLDFSRYAGLAGDRFVERAVTDEIMYELMALSGREYVDIYAQKLKQPVPTPLAA